MDLARWMSDYAFGKSDLRSYEAAELRNNRTPMRSAAGRDAPQTTAAQAPDRASFAMRLAIAQRCTSLGPS